MVSTKKNGNNRRKHILDIAMSVVFALLMVISVTGLAWHEWLGLVFAGMFTLHLVWNAGWIRSVTRNFANPKVKGRTRLLYVMNAALLASMLLCTVSGIFISHVVFSTLNVGGYAVWSTIHSITAYGSLALMVVHLVMHAGLIANGIRRIPERLRNSRPAAVGVRLVAAILVIVGLKNAFSQAIESEAASATSSSTGTTSSASDNGASSDVVASASSNGSDDATVQDTSDDGDASAMTLEEYLGSLHCTACGRHCPLSNPQCGRGETQAEEATAEYESTQQSSIAADDGTEVASAGTMNLTVHGTTYSVTLPS